MANWKIAFWIFAECQNMINHKFKSRSQVKKPIFAYLWLDNAKKQCKIWKTLWLAFLTLIFFALLNNSELRSWHCSLHNWRVLKRTFDESADRRSPSTTSSSSSLVLRSRKIALLWTSPLKLLCWKKFSFSPSIYKKEVAKVGNIFTPKSICLTENRLWKLQREEINNDLMMPAVFHVH